MIRSFLPIDLVDILLQAKSLSNKANTRDRLGERDSRYRDLAILMGQWFRGKSFTWVCTEGFSLHGLASVRECSGHQAWEVDRLLVHEGDRKSCQALLENMMKLGNDLEVRRIFLRLAFGSPLVESAVEAGFLPYKTECLYGKEIGTLSPKPPQAEMSSVPRRKQAGDEYRVFELYLSQVPSRIRRVEGLTFAEWRASRDRHPGNEWVFEKDGSVVGWLLIRETKDSGRFELMARSPEEVRSVIEYSLMHLGDRPRISCLAPEYDAQVFRLLEGYGFSQQSKYWALARECTAKVEEPCLMPAGA